MSNVIFAPKEMDERKVPTHQHHGAVKICHVNGWVVGTRLVGDEGYGPSVITITAIGKNTLLAECTRDGDTHEGSWTLHCRDWHPLDSKAGQFILNARNASSEAPRPDATLDVEASRKE